MNPLTPLPTRFAHIRFPAEEKRRRTINIAAPDTLLGNRPEQPPSLLPPEATAFLEWLFSQAGLDARLYRPESLARRLAACLRALRVHTIAQARLVLTRNPALVHQAISVMLVGVTSFFRDPLVFRILDQELSSLAGSRAALYVWSIGCSDGAELYSLAFLLAERGMLEGSYLLGTDCRVDAIHGARRGLFSDAEVKDVPPAYLHRYFQRQEDGWRVDDRIRRAMQWRTADILKSHEPGVWDIILFRNTAMYLRAEAADSLWPRFERSLRCGGILVLGRAERPNGAERFISIGPCLFRRFRRNPC